MKFLDDPIKKVKIEFFLKYGTMIIAAIWLLWSGTNLLDKRNKQLSISSMPVADTALTVTRDSKYNRTEIDGMKWDFCNLSGVYSITNTGALAIRIDEVTFRVYRLKNVANPKPNSDSVASYSSAPRVSASEGPIFKDGELLMEGTPETITVSEVASPGNSIVRTFGYIIPHKKVRGTENYYSYVVVAKAKGGLPKQKKGLLGSILHGMHDFLFGGDITEFGKNDLTHISGLSGICQAGLMKTDTAN